MFNVNQGNVFVGDLREMNGVCRLDVRDMFEQHIPLVKPFTYRCFTRFTGIVAQFCEIHKTRNACVEVQQRAGMAVFYKILRKNRISEGDMVPFPYFSVFLQSLSP